MMITTEGITTVEPCFPEYVAGREKHDRDVTIKVWLVEHEYMELAVRIRFCQLGDYDERYCITHDLPNGKLVIFVDYFKARGAYVEVGGLQFSLDVRAISVTCRQVD